MSIDHIAPWRARPMRTVTLTMAAPAQNIMSGQAGAQHSYCARGNNQAGPGYFGVKFLTYLTSPL